MNGGLKIQLKAMNAGILIKACVFGSARSQKNSGIGRLLVTVLEATELKACKPNGLE